MMERSFKRVTGSLDAIFGFLEEFAGANGLDDETRFMMNLVVEELFTNMVKYSPNGAPEIPIRLTCEAGRLEMRFVDHDVDEFDITKSRKVNTDLPLKERDHAARRPEHVSEPDDIEKRF